MRTIKSKFLLLSFLLLSGFSFCYAKNEGSAFPIHFLNKHLTEIVINDNFSPPVAARVYVYTNLAAYITLVESAGKENKLNSALISFPHLHKEDKQSKDFSPSVASAYAFYYISKKMIYTIPPFEDSFKLLLKWYKSEGYSDAEITNSQKIAKDYTDLFISWMNKDNFGEVKVMPEYDPDEIPGHWEPTYPTYAPALEPHWGLMRRLTANSDKIDVSKFKCLKYDTSRTSQIYKEAMGVYNVVTKATKEQSAIADFWDDNAFAVYPNGHVMTIIKKISPGGHWIYIACNAAEKSHADLEKSEFAYALTSTALFDAFIYTWKLKFQYKLLRPETYLQKQVDPEFRPYLQTPPFPEFPAGHSTISMAAATALTYVYGPSFHFTDNTEEYLKIPSRSFSSFKEAALEASVSRFYGGIHYKYSCEQGSAIGEAVANKIIDGIKK